MNEHKYGAVALIGRPNAGKSTLLNRILGQKIAITSDKPQTTRNRIVGIHTCEDMQVVLVDTPGIHFAKTRINRAMVTIAKNSLDQVLATWATKKERTPAGEQTGSWACLEPETFTGRLPGGESAPGHRFAPGGEYSSSPVRSDR